MEILNYPNNRLIVNGVDLSARYGLILVDGYNLEPPEPKTYTVDIPGGDGVIDLTESLLGDTAYQNRKLEFTFYRVNLESAVAFEQFMTEIKRFLHGKSFDFKITMDPEYTYHGRFTISNPTHSSYVSGIAGNFKMEIDADPFKYKDDQVYRIDAVGGKIMYFESGRKRVRPTIETEGFLKVIYKNKLYTLSQGTWTINDVLFDSGVNEVYFNSYDIKNLTWGDMKEAKNTWGKFKTKRLFEWYKSNGNGTQVFETWNDESSKTWEEISARTWGNLKYMSEVTINVSDIYVKYKVGDL